MAASRLSGRRQVAVSSLEAARRFRKEVKRKVASRRRKRAAFRVKNSWKKRKTEVGSNMVVIKMKKVIAGNRNSPRDGGG
ncbi:hypothetical protein TYRP_017377 [Tyrophagus putrescentiae]|nr:hypothetical protein TYRP_017377 [Tyrophagus putrescentiae]